MLQKTPTRFGAFLRAEFPLTIVPASAALFLALGSGVVENLDHPLALAGVFAWLFIGVLWSVISVVRHADCLALSKSSAALAHTGGKRGNIWQWENERVARLHSLVALRCILAANILSLTFGFNRCAFRK